ncbi:MAG TPA: glycosyltransferase family 4 protein [Thermoanaerobaculia bacterium]|nr:glycosyltransferase family 4 protein [Thermoanaerobaculia bacterium]
MKIAYIASGAGGMYCGSCLHDNTLAAALMRQGHDVALLPTYTPMRTDEEGVAGPRVFYGAINVFLASRWPALARLPRWVTGWLDRPGLLAWVSKRADSTDARELGAMTDSVLAGEEGAQAEQLEQLVTWLSDHFRPEVIYLTNSMFAGMARRLRRELGVPVVVGLVGEDLFLEDLNEPWRTRVIARLRERAQDVDHFLSPSRYYAEKMAALLDVALERVEVVPLGLRLTHHASEPPTRHGAPPSVGFFARLAPEKGLHLLVEAFCRLAAQPGRADLRLRVAGYLAGKDVPYVEGLKARLAAEGLAPRVDWVGEVDLEGKVAFLRSIDLLAVPTVYREAKGLFALEAMANATPVVLPRHGSLPEMIEATGGGILVEPGSAEALAEAIASLLDDPERRQHLGQTGRRAVLERFGEEEMARATAAAFERVIDQTRRIA